MVSLACKKSDCMKQVKRLFALWVLAGGSLFSAPGDITTFLPSTSGTAQQLTVLSGSIALSVGGVAEVYGIAQSATATLKTAAVVVRTGSANVYFTPGSDTDAARGTALSSAVSYVNGLARSSASPGTCLHSGLTLGSDGWLWGVTPVGGDGDRVGTVYRISSTGSYQRMYSGTSTIGTNMRAAPVEITGTMYCVAEGGPGNGGSIFAITMSSGSARLVKALNGSSEGAYPYGRLVASSGTLYGVTHRGGSGSRGVLFACTPAGSYTVLRTLADADGTQPYGGLCEGNDGLMYGTTTAGSGTTAYGSVFKVAKDGTGFSRLIGFSGTNGAKPFGGLIQAADGNFYGTTAFGGTAFLSATNNFSIGNGTLFRVSAAGDFSTLVNFTPTNGWAPFGRLVEVTGTLYGTCREGGQYRCGTVFATGTDGTGFAIKKSLGDINGAHPIGGLTVVSGTLYGTTNMGGLNNCGSVFAVTTAGALTSIYSAPGPAAGASIGIPGGVYEVSSPLYFRANNVEVYGAGMLSTVIRAGNSYSGGNLITHVYYSLLPASGVVVRDLGFDCNVASLAGKNVGAVTLGSRDCRLLRCRAVNWGSRDGTECFVFNCGPSGGEYQLFSYFFQGLGSGCEMLEGVVEYPAQTTHTGPTTAFMIAGGNASDWLNECSGWMRGGVISGNVVRNIANQPYYPAAFHAYSACVSRGTVVTRNTALDCFGSADCSGFYADTGSQLDTVISENNFESNYGIYITNNTVTRVRNENIQVLRNSLLGNPSNNASCGVQLNTGMANSYFGAVIAGNVQRAGYGGLYLAASGSGCSVTDNRWDVVGTVFTGTLGSISRTRGNTANGVAVLGDSADVFVVPLGRVSNANTINSPGTLQYYPFGASVMHDAYTGSCLIPSRYKYVRSIAVHQKWTTAPPNSTFQFRLAFRNPAALDAAAYETLHSSTGGYQFWAAMPMSWTLTGSTISGTSTASVELPADWQLRSGTAGFYKWTNSGLLNLTGSSLTQSYTASDSGGVIEFSTTP